MSDLWDHLKNTEQVACFAFCFELSTPALAFQRLSHPHTVTQSLWHHRVPSSIILCHPWTIPQLRGHSDAKKLELRRFSKEYSWEGKVPVSTVCFAHVPASSCVDFSVSFVVKLLQTLSEKRQIYKDLSVCMLMFNFVTNTELKHQRICLGLMKLDFLFFHSLGYGRLGSRDDPLYHILPCFRAQSCCTKPCTIGELMV